MFFLTFILPHNFPLNCASVWFFGKNRLPDYLRAGSQGFQTLGGSTSNSGGSIVFRKMMKGRNAVWGLLICFRDTCDWWHPTGPNRRWKKHSICCDTCETFACKICCGFRSLASCWLALIWCDNIPCGCRYVCLKWLLTLVVYENNVQTISRRVKMKPTRYH